MFSVNVWVLTRHIAETPLNTIIFIDKIETNDGFVHNSCDHILGSDSRFVLVSYFELVLKLSHLLWIKNDNVTFLVSGEKLYIGLLKCRYCTEFVGK